MEIGCVFVSNGRSFLHIKNIMRVHYTGIELSIGRRSATIEGLPRHEIV